MIGISTGGDAMYLIPYNRRYKSVYIIERRAFIINNY